MKSLLMFLFVIFFSLCSQAQLVINEFLAGNTTVTQDEYGEYDDWIEIYNSGSDAVILDSFYITDDFADPLKFQLPSSVTITGGGYLLIFADNDPDQGELHTNFKLSIDGEEIAIYRINSSDTLLIDSLSFQTQSNNISYGRFPDGNNHFEFFRVPSPRAANISDNLVGIADPPIFSIPGGFYSGSQSVELSAETPGAEIRYTTDGSEPLATSQRYTSPIISDTTFILKAKVIATDYLDSKTVGNTYFIDEHFMEFDVEGRLPVVSIACNREHLVGSQGILTNYNQDWERMVNIELFEPDGTNSINQYAGLKVYGNASRALGQKSLAAFARSSYGKGSFDYKFFDDKPFVKWESFVMRNGGSDWSLTYFRDGLCQALVRNKMHIDAQGSKHAILYLDGRFYGIIDLKEKVNEHYVEMNRGADPDNIDMLSDDQTLISGDRLKYADLRNFLYYNDMSNPALYTELNRQMDIPNFLNMQIAQIYIANIDMFLNSKFWRERENYGKWRWIMYDTEISFGQGDYSYTNDYGTTAESNTLLLASSDYGGSNWPYLRPWSSEKLIKILNNPNFRNDFIQTFAVHINTTFKPERILDMIDSMQLRVRNEIPMQIETWGGYELVFNPYGTHFTTIEEWEYYVDLMRVFAIQRPAYMRAFITDRFSLEGTYELTPTIADQEFGNIFIQDIKVPLDSAGIYFDNVPLHISARANEGYRFVRWNGIDGIDSASANSILTLAENTDIEAVFEPEGSIQFTEIYYKPSSGDISEFIEIHNPMHATSIDIGKYSLGGNISFTFPVSTILQPNAYIVIAADDSQISSGLSTRVFEWSVGNLPDTSGTLVLKDSLGLIVDSVAYSNQNPWPVIAANNSIELISSSLDNNIGLNWKAGISLGGSPGIPLLSEGVFGLKINEFVANNGDFFADEMNEYNDWIEILNTSSQRVDMAGLYFTNDFAQPCMYQIPPGSSDITIINPGEYKVIWADADIDQGPLHLGFKLDGAGGEIGISADGRTFIEATSYGLQASDVSLGRYTDGTDNWRNFSTPTPGIKNSMPPVFTSTPVLACTQGELYEYNLSWEDEDNDQLIFGKLTMPYWLQISDLTEGSALLSGIPPRGTQTTFGIKYFITDGFSAPVTQEFTITKEIPSDILNESYTANGFNCYPNPSEGVFYVEIVTNSLAVQINITNIDGKTVISRETMSSNGLIQEAIDMTDFQDGLYFITVKSTEGTFTQKMLLY
jgi:hypothetical protein